MWAHYTAKSLACRLRRPLLDVLFYPERPASMHYVVWKICAELGLRVTRQPSGPSYCLPIADFRRAVRMLALAFRDEFLPAALRC